MWTNKRVLLLMLGSIVFIAAYVGYAHVLGLGRIDGLPPLPEDLEHPSIDDGPLPPRQENVAEQRLRLAFGEECPELKRAIKLEVRSRGIVLAADQFTIEPDGRVKLQPFSIAIFGKTKVAGQFPEINTIRSDVAYLTFDRPISSPTEMSGRKIIGGELRQDDDLAKLAQDPQLIQERARHGYVGGVLLVNNRRTPARDDDMSLFTTGPVYYQEVLQRIWTKEAVKLIDMQSKPKPTEVKATGMDVYLTSEPAPSKGRPAPPPQTADKSKNSPSIAGVERVVLRGDVEMFLWVDSQSSFMGPPRDPKKASADRSKPAAGSAATPDPRPTGAAKPPLEDKDQVVISTQGPFEYIVETDRARFDISQHPGPYPNRVTVIRQHMANGPGEQPARDHAETQQHVATGPCDQLDCEHLEIQFRRKDAEQQPAGSAPKAPAAPAPAVSEDGAVQLEIESAHATGNQVVLTSDAEMLSAIGNDLVYNAVTRQSTIKGDPEMVAIKEGHMIYTRELVLLGIGDKDGQQATATGAGRIEMRDPKTGKPTLHARWKDSLVSSREGPFDVLTLTGSASFEDKEHGQLLKADVLKVWLEPNDDKKPPAASQEKNDTNSRKPHHLDARGNVFARAPEMNIQDTDHLVVWFKDAPPGQLQLPATLPQSSVAPGEANAQTPGRTNPATSAVSASPPPPAAASPPAGSTALPGMLGGPGSSQPDDQGKPKNPIDLSARFVEAFVLRSPSKNELDKIWCEGTVRVRQDPASPEEKGVDIRGQTLRLTHFAEGNVLLVTGDLAEVHLDKLSILGPEVNIDQKENHVWVNGIGAMQMPSKTSFQGDKLEREVEMTVHWNRNMFFNGIDAQFYGGIQAEQDNARLACQTMQVFLDRMVSLKDGDKGKSAAKVEKLICDKNVRIEDTQRENGKLVSYKRLDSRELVSDNPEGKVVAAGPGVVRILQYAAKDEGTPGSANVRKPTPDPAAKSEEELKLTRVTFLGRMFANNNTRIAIFYDNVEVVNVPSDNPDLPIDIDHLPEGGLYLRCEQLTVYSQKEANGKASQQMEAHRKAQVQSREFWGRADVIKYDESKEQVIFESSEGNLATLYRVKERGMPADEIKGKKITYWRRTNDFKVDSMNMMRSTN